MPSVVRMICRCDALTNCAPECFLISENAPHVDQVHVGHLVAVREGVERCQNGQVGVRFADKGLEVGWLLVIRIPRLCSREMLLQRLNTSNQLVRAAHNCLHVVLLQCMQPQTSSLFASEKVLRVEYSCYGFDQGLF